MVTKKGYKLLAVRVPTQLHRRLKVMAAGLDVTMEQLVQRTLTNMVDLVDRKAAAR